MKTQTKILILLVVTISVFASVFIGYQLINKQQEKLFLKANEKSKKQVIENILRFKEKSFKNLVTDYSCWDEMVKYIDKPTKEWEETNLTTLDAFQLSNTWIYNKDFKVIYSQFDSSHIDKPFALNKELIVKAFDNNGFCHFFMNVRDSLLEITGGTIVPSNDNEHKTTPNGYFLIGKLWGKKYTHELENEMDFAINFKPAKDSLFSKTADESKITISKVYKDLLAGNDIIVEFTSKNQLQSDLSSTKSISFLLISLIIITIILFSFFINRWISNPLSHITESLSTEDNSIVNELAKHKGEFGEVANLIRNFFEQKIQLEVEIAERIESQETVKELYEQTVNLNHELQASEEELRQNLDVTIELNDALSKQQREITDSINYAGRIQAALLPPHDLIKSLNREYFIFYKPRNIVSGDFYWVNQKCNKTIIAVADCTGHGVPGGFMSMLGMAFLAEIVNQSFELTSGEILDHLRKRVIDSLHQQGKSGESKDGLDIALCIIDFEAMKLQFSGAHNPLYLVRDKIDEDGKPTSEMIEVKGDRMPIGYSPRMDIPFITNEVEIYKDDVIYMVTDGFQDQLSNRTRQKFKRSKLRDLLVEIHSRDFTDQKQILELILEAYSDDYPQIDDVLAFGMKL